MIMPWPKISFPSLSLSVSTAKKSRLSVFDEPEAGIDLWSFGNLIRVFEKMHDEISGSILIISHQERILNIADQILVIADGKLVQNGSREEILPVLLDAPAASCKFYS